MFSRLVEAYGQDRYGYEGQERDDEMGWAPEPVNESNVGGNRGARDGSEDAQRGGSGSGGASMTPDEAMDKGMRLCSKRDDHWRGIVDCYFRIEGHFHAIQDLYRQIHYYTGCYPHRIECYSAYYHTVRDHFHKIIDCCGMIEWHSREWEDAQAELNDLMDLRGD
ncbi:hypothetical protein BDV36DRAFT_245311 [Aspergillus pseudocaelatus]|uniref:Uncharacterized protein n=1 Tax=Aspergillus pseudocaelatus TaxID=1825620 RepID=A0ABQ6WZG6_9EURO|nr:hypothetical protein BDV36DRAFT_245311 [Aspergillus pseudocaelatus]